MRRALLLSCLLSACVFGCADEAAEQAQQVEAVKQAVDDPWLDELDGLEDEVPAEAAGQPQPAAAPTPDPEASPTPDPSAAAASVDTNEAEAPSPTANPSPSAEPQPTASAAGKAQPSAPAPSDPAVPAPAAPASEPEDPVAAGELPPTEAAPAPAPEPAPPAEPAQPPPITLADFDGSYRFVGGNAQRQELAKTIEEAAMGLPGIIRNIGRKRLTKTNPIDASLSISVSGDKVTTTFASGFNPTATIGGGQVTWTSKKSGDTYRVRLKQKGSKLIQIIGGDDGVKTTVFVLSADRSRLTVHHKITADRLPEPMTYRLTYARN